MRCKFVIDVRTEPGIAEAAKTSKFVIVRNGAKKCKKWRVIVKSMCR